MKKSRRTFTAEFKAKIAIEAIKDLLLPFLKPPELFFKVKVLFLIKHLFPFSAHLF